MRHVWIHYLPPTLTQIHHSIMQTLNFSSSCWHKYYNRPIKGVGWGRIRCTFQICCTESIMYDKSWHRYRSTDLVKMLHCTTVSRFIISSLGPRIKMWMPYNHCVFPSVHQQIFVDTAVPRVFNLP